jgi:hypothetical protein
LVNHYRNSGWLISVGHGAVARADDIEVRWPGGLYALQEQLDLPIHPGGLTALALRGHVHDVNLGAEQVYLFGSPEQKLPSWFANYNWQAQLRYHTTNLFSDLEFGLEERMLQTFSLVISSPERAILETMSLVPKGNSFEQALHAMESLLGLRPKLIQKLLRDCYSIKAKRLFLYLAEELTMPWFESLNVESLDLGSGKRVIAGGGKYSSKYQISVPQWETNSA